MACNKKKPCDDCPFRKKSLPGWLGPHTVDEFVAYVQFDYPYPCHKTLVEGRETVEDTELREGENICIGLVHLRNNSCKKARDEDSDLRKEEIRLKGEENECFANTVEFAKHHSKEE